MKKGEIRWRIYTSRLKSKEKHALTFQLQFLPFWDLTQNKQEQQNQQTQCTKKQVRRTVGMSSLPFHFLRDVHIILATEQPADVVSLHSCFTVFFWDVRVVHPYTEDMVSGHNVDSITGLSELKYEFLVFLKDVLCR